MKNIEGQELRGEEGCEGALKKNVSEKVKYNWQVEVEDLTIDVSTWKVAMAALSLPQAGAWLQCPPVPALSLHLRNQEFVVV